jgi:hypothetical protein
MIRVRGKSWLPSNLLLALLLFGAQSGALAHAFEHDPGSLQNPTCAICVTVSQLDSGCINIAIVTMIARQRSSEIIEQPPIFHSVHTLNARQRGPPTSL